MKSKTVSVLMRLYRGMHHLPANLFVVFWGAQRFRTGILVVSAVRYGHAFRIAFRHGAGEGD